MEILENSFARFHVNREKRRFGEPETAPGLNVTLFTIYGDHGRMQNSSRIYAGAIPLYLFAFANTSAVLCGGMK